ncbi:MAG TPA: hypothetical protein VII53_10745 [Solirubrobacteraceae bacterium]
MNQIRSWVRQGRTDAWVAHQLEVSVRDIEQFKRQNELVSDEEPAEGGTGADYPGEIDLRAEDDALIAAELEAAEIAAEIEAARVKAEAPEDEESDEDRSGASLADGDTDGEGAQDAPRRRRGRRGGRGRRPIGDRPTPRGSVGPLEGTFEHGEEGYGLWLDPAVQDNPIYAEHWAGHRSVEVLVEEDQIVIRRTGTDD